MVVCGHICSVVVSCLLHCPFVTGTSGGLANLAGTHHVMYTPEPHPNKTKPNFKFLHWSFFFSCHLTHFESSHTSLSSSCIPLPLGAQYRGKMMTPHVTRPLCMSPPHFTTSKPPHIHTASGMTPFRGKREVRKGWRVHPRCSAPNSQVASVAYYSTLLDHWGWVSTPSLPSNGHCLTHFIQTRVSCNST